MRTIKEFKTHIYSKLNAGAFGQGFDLGSEFGYDSAYEYLKSEIKMDMLGDALSFIDTIEDDFGSQFAEQTKQYLLSVFTKKETYSATEFTKQSMSKKLIEKLPDGYNIFDLVNFFIDIHMRIDLRISKAYCKLLENLTIELEQGYDQKNYNQFQIKKSEIMLRMWEED